MIIVDREDGYVPVHYAQCDHCHFVNREVSNCRKSIVLELLRVQGWHFLFEDRGGYHLCPKCCDKTGFSNFLREMEKGEIVETQEMPFDMTLIHL